MSEAEQQTSGNDSVQTTRLNRGWVMKMLIFAICLIGLGAWGTLDAFVVYPNRGRQHAKFMLYQYLGRLSDSGMLLRSADVADPASELTKLRSDSSIGANSIEAARRDWLLSLSRVYDLNEVTQQNRRELDRRAADAAGGQQPTPTLFPDARGLHSALEAELQNATVPAPLNAYDIPLQFLFMAIGFGGGVWILLLLVRCARNTFRYDPGEMRLTLPDGRSFTPAQIKDVDKRDWHKYYLYFTVEGIDGELKFDLLRYAPLEEWVESMRKARPGYDPAEDESKDKGEPAPPPADAAEEPADVEAERQA